MADIRQVNLPGAVQQQALPTDAAAIAAKGKYMATGVDQLGQLAGAAYGEKVLSDFSAGAEELNKTLYGKDEPPIGTEEAQTPEYDPRGRDTSLDPTGNSSQVAQEDLTPVNNMIDRMIGLSNAVDEGTLAGTQGRLLMEKYLREALANHPQYTDELVAAGRNIWGINPLGSQLAAAEAAERARMSEKDQNIANVLDFAKKNGLPTTYTNEAELRQIATNVTELQRLKLGQQLSDGRMAMGLATMQEESAGNRTRAYTEAMFELEKLSNDFFPDGETYAQMVKSGRLEEFQRAVAFTKQQFIVGQSGRAMFKGQPDSAVQAAFPQVFALFDSYANENSSDHVAKMAGNLVNAANMDAMIADPSLVQIKMLEYFIGNLPEGTMGQFADATELKRQLVNAAMNIMRVTKPDGSPLATPVTEEILMDRSTVQTPNGMFSDLNQTVNARYLLETALSTAQKNPDDLVAQIPLFRTSVAVADGIANWEKYHPGEPQDPKLLKKYLEVVGTPEWINMFQNATSREQDALSTDAFNNIQRAVDTASYHIAATMMAPWGTDSRAEPGGYITIWPKTPSQLLAAVVGSESQRITLKPDQFFIFNADDARIEGKITVTADREHIKTWVEENLPGGMWGKEDGFTKVLGMVEGRIHRMKPTIELVEQAARTKSMLLMGPSGSTLTTPGVIIDGILTDLVRERT